jgi:natural product precursor
MKKLTLKKQTVRNLTNDEMGKVAGGTYMTDNTCACGDTVAYTSCGPTGDGCQKNRIKPTVNCSY